AAATAREGVDSAVDPSRTGTSVSARQRRELLKAVVRDNVYIKAGKRPPLGRSRSWRRWTALTVAVPGLAAGTFLLLPNRATAPPAPPPAQAASAAPATPAGVATRASAASPAPAAA